MSEKIVRRCLDPGNKSYPDYGGRGITMHPEWLADYAAFLRDMGERPDGFDDRPYPVLGIDVIDDQETRFLLADREGRFSWIDMATLRRTE